VTPRVVLQRLERATESSEPAFLASNAERFHAAAAVLRDARVQCFRSAADAEAPPTSWSGEGRLLLAEVLYRGERAGCLVMQGEGDEEWSGETAAFAASLADYIGLMLERLYMEHLEKVLADREQNLFQSQKLAGLGRLVSGVAHDFNNFLTAITISSELLLEDTKASDARRPLVQEIHMVADRATALTQKLLSFSRIQRSSAEQCDANEVVCQLEHVLRHLIGEHIQLRTSVWPSELRTDMDPRQLEIVLMNLAANARDAMPNGGLLRIDAQRCDALPPKCQASGMREDASYVLVCVQDSGEGIAPEDLERVFEPFYTTKAAGSGTGLGLAGIKESIEAAGGQITVDSRPGEGARFCIYLPEASPKPQRSKPPKSPAQKRESEETVLVVEDEQVVLELVRRILQDNGYRVLAYTDPSEALEAASSYQERIHVLLTDVVLPGISGIELARRFGAQRPEAHVLCMSGYADDPNVKQLLSNDEHALLCKPFRRDALIDAVRNVLQSSDHGPLVQSNGA
jgi:signal transduction histidine kinase/ActR/RegA family two-component response regulator